MDQMTEKGHPFFTPLKQIFHPKGDIWHALKKSDKGFNGFGEAYFTTVHHGDVKGWKKHTKMQMNLIVPMGIVCFYLHDELAGQTIKYVLGSNNYGRLTVPPGYWMAFSGLSLELNLVLNLASIEHDPSESINVSLETYPLESSA